MIRKLFILAICFSVLGCTNDDNQPDGLQELKIKKFSQLFYAENSAFNIELERLFDESGQAIREDKSSQNTTLYWMYYYNDLGIITEKSRFYEDGTKTRTDIFTYDANKNIDSITFKNGDDNISSVRQYTIESDKITFQQSSNYGEIYYDAQGRIVQNYTSGDTGNTTQTIEYSGDNITKINLSQSNGYVETYTFEYDEGLNPLYTYYKNNYFNATIGDHLSFLKRPNYFSKNNFIRVTYNSSTPNSNYIKTKATIYNTDGYPTSAVIEKNDVLDEEMTYDYY